MPQVSVCIPTYNRCALLQDAIASVQAQTWTDWDLWVCDDGSSDGTAEWMASLTDARIHYLRHPRNIGKSNNMRSGFEAATGQYFLKFDDDDRLTPEFLARTVAILERDPGVDCVATDHWVINAEGDRDLEKTEANSRLWGRTELPEGAIADLLTVTFVHQSVQIGATLFRRSVLDALGYMRPDLQNCEDNDLLVRLALAGQQAYYLPERLMEYRFHAPQQDFSKSLGYLKDKIQYLEFFEFEQPELEQIRQHRLAECRLTLGIRLVRAGQGRAGRSLLWQGRRASFPKAIAAWGMSWLRN